MNLLGQPSSVSPKILPHPSFLPAMSLAEAIDTTRIPRVASRTDDRTGLVTTVPFRAPHHTSADLGLIGGGHVPMQGIGVAGTQRHAVPG
jgi:magnesium chelatase family protein